MTTNNRQYHGRTKGFHDFTIVQPSARRAPIPSVDQGDDLFHVPKFCRIRQQPSRARDNHLGVGIQSRLRPNITRTSSRRFGVADVLVLGIAKRPDFIASDSLALRAANILIVVGDADLARVNEQF
jgi:hypothetical protein